MAFVPRMSNDSFGKRHKHDLISDAALEAIFSYKHDLRTYLVGSAFCARMFRRDIVVSGQTLAS